MRRLPVYTLIFSLAFIAFFFAPPFTSKQFGLYPLMKTGDVIDMFTPLVLIPLYWLLFRISADTKPNLKETLAFAVLAAFWVEGHGMHLTANSISHLLTGGSDVFKLTHFYDEALSHYMWHFGIIGLAGLIIHRQWRNPLAEPVKSRWLLWLAGIIHGFSFFLVVLEGATLPMSMTFTVLAVIFGLVWGRKNLAQNPLMHFFLASYVVTIVLFAGWGLYWGGFPEPSAIWGF